MSIFWGLNFVIVREIRNWYFGLSVRVAVKNLSFVLFEDFGLVGSVRQSSGIPVFNPRSRHTKNFKTGTWYLLA